MDNIHKFIPNPSMDYLSTEDMEEVDSKIDQLLQNTMDILKNKKPIKNKNYGNGAIVINESGDESNAECNNNGNESSKSDKSDDDYS